MQVGIVPHRSGVIDGRLECTFSRIITVLPGEENSDFNLDASYYIIIGTGKRPGIKYPVIWLTTINALIYMKPIC